MAFLMLSFIELLICVALLMPLAWQHPPESDAWPWRALERRPANSALRQLLRRCLSFWRSRPGGRRLAVTPGCRRRRLKPAWVIRHVIHLKAVMPRAGCRRIADCFNQRYAQRGTSVSKSFVAYTLRKHAHEILRLRRKLKHRIPKPERRNTIWGLDLTGKSDATGKLHHILGLIDHASRFNLRLDILSRKCVWTILGHLCLAIASGLTGAPASTVMHAWAARKRRKSGLASSPGHVQRQIARIGRRRKAQIFTPGH